MEYIKKNKNNILILLDFDGTIMNTAKFNWECYNVILKKYNKNITFQDFLLSINNSHLDIFFRDNLNLKEEEIIEIREKKYELMYTQIETTHTLEFVPGMEEFINYIETNNIPHCVVTNTSIKPINMYKEHFPILKKLKNWITREDYNLPKPNPECYKLAIERYGKDKHTIGFEDSWVGYQALKNTVDEIYIINGEEQVNYDKFQKENVNLLANYNCMKINLQTIRKNYLLKFK
jgi:HAD superfamily hydrolase (TIGR01509 family)